MDFSAFIYILLICFCFTSRLLRVLTLCHQPLRTTTTTGEITRTFLRIFPILREQVIGAVHCLFSVVFVANKQCFYCRAPIITNPSFPHHFNGIARPRYFGILLFFVKGNETMARQNIFVLITIILITVTIVFIHEFRYYNIKRSKGSNSKNCQEKMSVFF